MSGSNNNMISSLNQARQLVKDIQEQISQIYAVAPSLQETPILEGASGQIQDILIHCYSERYPAREASASQT